MDAMQARELAFEGKFAHDAELEYKIRARSFKKLGLWAASVIGLKDWIALDYANGIMDESLDNDELKIAQIIVADFIKSGNKEVEATHVLSQLQKIIPLAREEVYAG